VRGAFSQDGSSKPGLGDTLHIVIPEEAALPEGAPKRLGSYELLERIAQGGMGVVYKARHAGLDRVVALKMIRSGVLATPRDVERFQREARSAAKLRHPNIVTIHDIGEQEGQHYYTMDYVPGENLCERARTKPFSPRQAAEITAGVAAAIDYAHQSGVLHRDIKPANVILTPEQQPRVLDFGLALILADDSTLTQTGTPVGSPPYMPPEQAAGQTGRIDARSDVYGLGALLYDLLTGHPPFRAASTMETLRLVIENEVVPPRRLNPALPSDLETICLKCLEKDPNRRYQTAQELGEELGRFIRDEPILAHPISRVGQAWRWCRRKPLVASLSAATLALLICVAIGSPIALYKINQERKETRRRAYAAEINVAFQALAENNLGRAIELLNRQRPRPGEEDLRGFEWRHLWQLCQSDEKETLPQGGQRGIAFSPDGKWFVHADDKIVVRELPSLSVVHTVPRGAGALAFSPDGKLLASSSDSRVRIWRTGSWKEERTLPGTRLVAVFSPDGQWLLTGAPGPEQGTPGGYRVWNTETWEPGKSFGGELERVWVASRAVAFSSDGTLLVTAGHPEGRESGHQFQVWDFPSLTARTNFEKFPGRLASAAFAPDGKHLLTGAGDGGVLLVWNVAEGRIVERLKEHTGWLSAITCGRDARTFATASSDRTLVLWDAATRKALVRLRGHLGQVTSAAMSPDGRLLASGALDGTTKLWDATTRHAQRKLPECLLVTGFSSDSRRLVGIGYRESRLWNLEDDARRMIPLQDYNKLRDRNYFGFMSASEDVHGVEPNAVFGRTNGVLEVWNLATMSRVTSWRVDESNVATAAFSPDGQFIATSGAKGDVILWEAGTRRELRRFKAWEGPLMCLRFSPDGRLLAGSENKSMDSHVGLWDVNTGALLRTLNLPGHLAFSLAFSPDGKLLATAEQNETAQLWDIPSGAHRATLTGHVQPVVGVAFSPDGKTLATAADDCKVKLWNIATKQEVATLELPGGCRSVRFSPDGRIMAVGYLLEPEQYVLLWEVPSFEEIAVAEAGQKTEIRRAR
jgi:WD40 repeat protein/tRNA A-37 threonylcarbamoyl transferase component Bud32